MGPHLLKEGRPLRSSMWLQEECTWSGEGERGHLPSQPHQQNHPWQSMGDRDCSQLTLTYVAYSFLKKIAVVELGEMGGQRETVVSI